MEGSDGSFVPIRSIVIVMEDTEFTVTRLFSTKMTIAFHVLLKRIFDTKATQYAVHQYDASLAMRSSIAPEWTVPNENTLTPPPTNHTVS